jgi:putative membrane protein
MSRNSIDDRGRLDEQASLVDDPCRPAPAGCLMLEAANRPVQPADVVDGPLDPRISLANERTLLSWMHCALALVAAGTTAGTLVDIEPVWLHALVALVPIGLGLSAVELGFIRWRRVDDAVRAGVALPVDRELRFVALAVSLAGTIAGGAVVVGVFFS